MKPIFGIASFISLMALIVVGLKVVKFKPTSQPDLTVIHEKLKRDDSALLNNPSTSDSLLLPALLRLGRAKDPAVLEVALQKVQSPLPTLRAAVAEVLGGYDDPRATEALLKLAWDPVADVQTGAANALAISPLGERRAAVVALLKDTRLTEEMMSTIYSGLLLQNSSNSMSERTQWLVKLRKLARSSNQKSAWTALTAVLSQESKSPETLQLVEEILSEPQAPHVVQMGLDHLIFHKREAATRTVEKLLRSSLPETRKLALGYLKKVCAGQQWDWLEKIVREDRDLSVVTLALQVTPELDPRTGLTFLERWKTLVPKSDRLGQMIETELDRARTLSQTRGSCPSP